MKQSIYYLFILAIPVACVAWTVTKEEIFRELRSFFTTRSKNGTTLLKRKFFYVFTCEYCFSHYVSLILLAVTNYTLLYSDWRGYLIAGFSIVWIANVYMGLYNLLRIDLKKGKIDADKAEKRTQTK